ncbi:MerR family transcriptional regulator [Crassaminicella thermophila]|uniref:MerR family transcriptional regulator n=1 Tax=Crassaminicella thermophila TaxID=2599308 RepID=A0A5C0SDI6_CRATE|nr:TIGR03826 family flagellar region protein [Crassaminicella thermophila]QEK11304.1 MerR family transcriptional regulator [Crassaminicella thermophila]
MAEIRNCKECGRIFQYTGISKICPKCRREDEKNFKIVKEYIYENQGATLTEVSEETGVPEDKILRYLREGKLEIVGENSALLLSCERCGKGIRTGRFCDACAQELKRELTSGFKQPNKTKQTQKEKMYTAERKKRKW